MLSLSVCVNPGSVIYLNMFQIAYIFTMFSYLLIFISYSVIYSSAGLM